MSNKKSAKGFPCLERGCTGLMTVNNPVKWIALQTDCHSSTCAVSCPVCGRLYWGKNRPCRNRQFDNAYMVNNAVQHRPMPASEKKSLVGDHIEHSKARSMRIEIKIVRDALEFLIQKGHASDCPAKDNKGECACGNTEAEKWIEKHPCKEIALTT